MDKRLQLTPDRDTGISKESQEHLTEGGGNGNEVKVPSVYDADFDSYFTSSTPRSTTARLRSGGNENNAKVPSVFDADFDSYFTSSTPRSTSQGQRSTTHGLKSGGNENNAKEPSVFDADFDSYFTSTTARSTSGGKDVLEPVSGVDANAVLDTMLNLSRTVLARADGRIPLSDMQLPILPRNLSRIPFLNLFLPRNPLLGLTNGYATGIESIHRIGDATLFRRGRDFILEAPLRVDSLQVYFKGFINLVLAQFSLNVGGLIRDADVKIKARTSINIGRAGGGSQLALEDFDILKVGDIRVAVKGLDPFFNDLASIVATGVKDVFRDFIYDLIEPLVQRTIENGFSRGMNRVNDSPQASRRS
ncbi:unnamed protein product [Darwinula stevensoni]|uniref:Uncharacterized protein n=1 Tax=Darwinula stevensoni TaxID=69355 RepID=A0A7R8X2L3_9CRUS|nr:unnamed protein product [Darwinula stevensoni]CAG0883421.1 unnamed protein product [Darwinula stevensoni]